MIQHKVFFLVISANKHINSIGFEPERPLPEQSTCVVLNVIQRWLQSFKLWLSQTLKFSKLDSLIHLSYADNESFFYHTYIEGKSNEVDKLLAMG